MPYPNSVKGSNILLRQYTHHKYDNIKMFLIVIFKYYKFNRFDLGLEIECFN